jgi:CrcB protein
MRALLLISLGGILGANARYLVTVWAAGRWRASFPHGTLIANVSGSFLLGFFLEAAASGWVSGADARLLIATGFCGAYTTFSTFAFESVALSRQRDLLPAMVNVAGSALLGLAAAAAGILVAGALR